jgi:hypothetical protein
MSFFVSEEIKDLVTENNLIEKKYSIQIKNKKCHINAVKNVKFYKDYAKATLNCTCNINPLSLLLEEPAVYLFQNNTQLNLDVSLLRFSKKKDSYLFTIKILFNN